MPSRWLLLSLFGAVGALAAPAPSQALPPVSLVCTPAWSSAPVLGAVSAPFSGATPPCPNSATASVQVGTGANAGTVNAGDSIVGPGTDALGRTSVTSVDLGIKASITETLTVTFSQTLPNPYLFFTYLDAGDSIDFGVTPFALIDANNAQRSGTTVTFAGSTNLQSDGFIAQLLGDFSTFSFVYGNPNAGVESVAFTTGVQVPGPLPLMGAGLALGFTRRLRRRFRA